MSTNELTQDVIDFVTTLVKNDPGMRTADCAEFVNQQFCYTDHITGYSLTVACALRGYVDEKFSDYFRLFPLS